VKGYDMTTYDDFTRPTTDTTMIFASDAGIHSDSDTEEYEKAE